MTAGDIVLKIFVVLSPALAALLAWASTRLVQLITAKVKFEYLRGVLVRLDDVVFAAVREIQQTVVDDLKSNSPDGRLTPAQRDQLKQDVLAKIKSHIGMKGLAEIAKILGLDGVGLDNFIATKAEAAVHDLKVTRTAAGAAAGAAATLVPTTA
jgi:hypothetical protein